jgi:hypothetical protein
MPVCAVEESSQQVMHLPPFRREFLNRKALVGMIMLIWKLRVPDSVASDTLDHEELPC